MDTYGIGTYGSTKIPPAIEPSPVRERIAKAYAEGGEQEAIREQVNARKPGSYGEGTAQEQQGTYKALPTGIYSAQNSRQTTTAQIGGYGVELPSNDSIEHQMKGSSVPQPSPMMQEAQPFGPQYPYAQDTYHHLTDRYKSRADAEPQIYKEHRQNPLGGA